MSNISVKEALVGILSKSMTTEQAFAGVKSEDRQELTTAIAYVKECLSKSKPEYPSHNNRGQWSLQKAEPLSKPPVSENQRKAMWAAAKGHSNLGIPSSVGKDFAESDPGGKLPKKKKEMEKEEKEYKKVKVQMDSDTYDEPEKHNPDLAAPGKDGGGRLRKTWETGQWGILEKSVLDYSKINPKPKRDEENAPKIDYSGGRMADPVRTPGKKDMETASAVQARRAAETKAKEAMVAAPVAPGGGDTALNAIKQKQQAAKKAEGVNVDQEVDATRMTAKKNELMGYGQTMSAPAAMKSDMPGEMPAGSSMAMSEKEPHKDDPKHEKKEKDKAKKIKDEAEGILDMHKQDTRAGY